MTNKLSRYKSTADAIARLFHPYAEVVIHTIEEDCIYYISNSISGRKAVSGPTNFRRRFETDT